MEAVLMNSSGDYKPRIGNPKRNFGTNRPLFSHPSDNLLLATFLAGGHCGGGGLLSMPPPSHLSHSYPPAVSVFRSPHSRQQPPLLPLPIPMPLNHQNINISRTNSTPHNDIRLSSPRINKSAKNRVRDHSLTPKKSKNQKKDSKKEGADLVPASTTEKKKEAPPAKNCSTEASVNQMMGPDPKDLPKAVISRVFSSSPNDLCDIVSVDKFSGSVVFTPSPPPSSLPLPTFSLRPKLSCKAEAAAAAPSVDAGATDSLRRLLRLRKVRLSASPLGMARARLSGCSGTPSHLARVCSGSVGHGFGYQSSASSLATRYRLVTGLLGLVADSPIIARSKLEMVGVEAL